MKALVEALIFLLMFFVRLCVFLMSIKTIIYLEEYKTVTACGRDTESALRTVVGIFSDGSSAPPLNLTQGDLGFCNSFLNIRM